MLMQGGPYSIGLPNPKLAFVDVTVIGAYER